MNFKTEVKVDDLGRFVIPKHIRKKFSIKENEYLLLDYDEEKITLRKKIVLDKYKNIIDKLNYLKDNYNLSLIMIDNNEVIYTTLKYEYLLNKKIDKKLFELETFVKSKETKITKNDVLRVNHCYFPVFIDVNTKGILFVEDNDSFKDIELLYELLK